MAARNEDHGERIAALETKMTTLLGNGKDGMIDKLEKKVENVNSKVLIIGIVLIVLTFCSGSGSLSLKTMLDLILK